MSDWKEIEERYTEAILNDGYFNDLINITTKDYMWLIEQAERVQELENRNKELEYASKYNGELNEFLQKKKLPPKTLGRHVVDVVMEYVQELELECAGWKEAVRFEDEKLEQQNKRYREAINKAIEQMTDYSEWGEVREGLALDILNKALESESE